MLLLIIFHFLFISYLKLIQPPIVGLFLMKKPPAQLVEK
nr:MAG TPA: hypothetical protein [Caudoviricetes sp.]